ncbi:Far-red impaired responsive (FAR1) family protein [Tripterygium wilfordii]|uniref:Far-red impaired responsive (FAR1) family protein n=1 Tax=Tripterygium wilfordii TaxID=458696 RepID=A0A7J7C3M8_TRIWF|nr:Far-red impaired responsive (FAR1) family protein [Tripterygium wilfordii]
MNFNMGATAMDNAAGGEMATCGGDVIIEPHEGMEFESEDAAKIFYDEYARLDHNHPLVVAQREARQTMDEKDKKIQELTAELRNKKRLCTAYQEQLTAFMRVVEEHSEQLSKKFENVVNNLKEFEPIDQLLLHRS